jgi:hypothetical protein
LQFVKINFNNFLLYVTNSQLFIFNLIFTIILITTQTALLLFYLTKNRTTSNICLGLGIVKYVLNPLFARYLIKLLFNNYISFSIRILSFLSILLILIHEILYLIISSNPQTKN